MKNRIILDANELIICPDCGHEFALGEGITRQAVERYQGEFDDELKREREVLREQLEVEADRRVTRKYESQVADLKEQLTERGDAFDQLKKKLLDERKKAADEVRAEAEERAAAYEKELEAKDNKIKDYQTKELELRRERQELEDEKQEMKIQLQRRLDEEKKKLREEVAGEYGLREAEYKKKIEDAQKANAELKRKLERGSQQLQGEVLELEIENVLTASFPFDQIQEVKKGVRGADVIHSVMTRSEMSCGKILWESKRAEKWSNGWITKLKDDQQEAGAEIAVLVSTVFPSHIEEPFVLEDGVWLVKPYVVRAVAEALRSVLIESARQKVITQGRNVKAEAVYDYLCTPQFAQKIRGVVETSRTMQEELDREKAAFTRIWKKREVQIERITTNMLGMCGEIQGISDNSLTQLESIGLLLDADEE